MKRLAKTKLIRIRSSGVIDARGLVGASGGGINVQQMRVV
jgi:hypothetical protein